MPNKTRSTFQKRQKELARQARRMEKVAKRLEQAAASSAGAAPVDPTEDPDLVGIKLGPQPRVDDENDDGAAWPRPLDRIASPLYLGCSSGRQPLVQKR